MFQKTVSLLLAALLLTGFVIADYRFSEILREKRTYLVALFRLILIPGAFLLVLRLLQVPGVIGMYKNGRAGELPHLVRHFRVKELTIHCDAPTPINLDGELRTATEVVFEIAKEKLRFFYPKELTWEKEAAKV